MDTAEPDLERPLPGPLYSPGVLQALHDHEETGVDVQHQVPASLGCPGQVVVSPTAPDWTVTVGSLQLVPEVEPIIIIITRSLHHPHLTHL